MAKRGANNGYSEIIYLLFWGGGSKITADGDWSHEIKTFTPWKESYDQPRQHIKKRRHYFANKVPSSQFSSAQSLSHVRLFATPCTTACQASLSITNSRSPPKLMCIESVMPSSHLILCCPLLLLSPIPPGIRIFSNESTLRIRWPKYWSFSLSISPSKEHPGLVSFRMDLLDLLAVQGTLQSLLQHHSSKASIFQRFLYSPTLTSTHDYWQSNKWSMYEWMRLKM